ncbi:MAG: hypothetical protein HDQ88_10775 [Clostridia bacterium]|nr:hypothetical protein [Clostridia bacterium]
MMRVLAQWEVDNLLRGEFGHFYLREHPLHVSQDFDNSPAAVELRLEQERWVREHTYSLLEV